MECVFLIQVFILQIFLYTSKCSSSHIDSIPICSTSEGEPHEVHLTAHGVTSSAYVLLRDSDVDAASLIGKGIEGRMQWPHRGRTAVYPSPEQNQHICRLKVTAPPGHVVYVEVLETRLEIHSALIVHHEERDTKCPLEIFLPDKKSKPVYTANMCDVDHVADVQLLPSELELTWKPPPRSDSSDFEMLTKDRMLLITAVGNEATCKPSTGVEGRNKYHTCMKIGWDPILCVSKDLMCNGQKNCPKGSTSSDEAEAICRAPQSLEDIARKIIQEFQLPLGFNEKWVENAKKQTDSSTTTESTVANQIASIWKKIEASTRRPHSFSNTEDSMHSKTHPSSTTDTSTLTISTILNQYGPWGYLMLGMLICGGVLLLCGMWECCCRRPKPFLGSHGQRNNTVGHRSAHGGPTVLIMNHGEDGGVTGRPPEYDDLDQPPLYSALFPNNKVVEQGMTVIQMQDRRPSEDEIGQQQSSQLIRQNSSVNHNEVIDTSTSNIAPPKDETSESNVVHVGTTSAGTVSSASNDS